MIDRCGDKLSCILSRRYEITGLPRPNSPAALHTIATIDISWDPANGTLLVQHNLMIGALDWGLLGRNGILGTVFEQIEIEGVRRGVSRLMPEVDESIAGVNLQSLRGRLVEIACDAALASGLLLTVGFARRNGVAFLIGRRTRNGRPIE